MRYRRAFIPATSYFFTVNLAERKNKLLIDNIGYLKGAFAKVKHPHPFKANALVVMPAHLHMIMNLPADDAITL